MAVLACALVACGSEPEGPKSFEARGVVVDVKADEGQVVIDHEDIPGMMPAMTMSFDVPDASLLEKLEPGQEIDFTVEFDGRSYRVTGFWVRGGGPEILDQSRLRFENLLPPDAPAPEFALVDQGGAALALDDLRGRAVLLDFVFTHCPGPCPILTGTHVELQRMLPEPLRERVHFVSISLDPERDTPEALRAYATARGADLAGWSFLTGAPEAVDPVLESYGVGRVRTPDGQIDHFVVTYLIDGEGRVARRYIGLEHEPAALLSDLRSVL